jgi:hypothetical protein
LDSQGIGHTWDIMTEFCSKNLVDIYLLEDLYMCEDNIKISLKEMDWEVVEWVIPVQDRKK